MAKGKADTKKGDAKKGAADKKGDKGDKDVKGAQQINVRHILCEKHAKKEEALAKIRDEGAKFDDVARTHSEDKARQGGALGWKVRGSLDPAFEAVAFELPASTTASPVVGEAKTSFGYHIIMVEGRK
ncbi:peptidyl-prolyl cis-trans isomerase NIMA-interacting 4 [Sporothrix schenckii 1099-18]|uniref:Peptidyl-prolyl cis-trans isomerase n=2 Tax=Sporothrix schenckii TaxID=29908 RepID=U7PZP2_SPOS1|nr:peptidyl-prolyl cis-trans isomerase NIMA-interacting 4 [Sporothrix schenckii 1099-18]ERS99925.1 hypothetical protein HMPREF1624_03294 [Sporothrix schenckii ATCC 58251]KJR85675.1 peptidyl-prolyl cis-trans isomerase NIMA-interacting 4 [Sporothrix schenckii 1099-18]